MRSPWWVGGWASGGWWGPSCSRWWWWASAPLRPGSSSAWASRGASASSPPAPPCTRKGSAAWPREPPPGWSEVTAMDSVRLAILGALAASRIGMERADLLRALDEAGVPASDASRVLQALRDSGRVSARESRLELSPSGILALLELHAEIERALDPSPPLPEQEQCPSIPWLTAVQTCWIDALSLNYRGDAKALAPLLPAPLEPEIHKGHGWVQILMSSLRDMRPPGMPSLFGTCFYQVSD